MLSPDYAARRFFLHCMALCLVILLPVATTALAQSGPQVYQGAELVEVVTPFVFTGDLRALPEAPSWQPGDPIKEIPRRFYPLADGSLEADTPRPANQGPDPLLSAQEAAPGPSDQAFSTPILNFPGQGYTGVNPPDTVGDVGPTYYIQMINAGGGAVYTIYDKANGAVVAGPTFLDTLGSGFCGSGLGDPVVLYDELAGRWMLSEFSSSGNRLCVYVSQTSDPVTGGWYNYDFQAPGFPDYPKYAVWPDAYYITSNESSPAIYALERSQMLLGAAASNQRFTAPDLAGFGFQALTPGDHDGDAGPPAGSPAYFMRHRDDERHNSGSNNPALDFLEVWDLDVDFANAANSTFTGPLDIGIAEIDSGLCGFTSFNCFPQPGTSVTLDPLREVVMWRLQYRNFGGHEALIGNLVTDVDGTDRGGIRWFELRKSGAAAWSLFQEGTYSPDADNRFMGAIAMDGDGNIAVGYNVSSSSVFPGLRYAGRLAGDPAGTLPQGEFTIIDGQGSNASNRYGDYSAMSVDPVDDCTFWFTGEHNATSQWSTRIATFSFAGCGSGAVCGNNMIEGGEVCDGTDLGGQTCSSQGCTGGTLACNPSCSGFDTSGCTGCAVCDFDGVCEAGEDCNGCPTDCASGTTAGAACGNGICEAGDGENCLTCAADCAGKQNGKPANRFCCGDGTAGQGAVTCSDARCTTGGFSCTDVPQPPGSFCCGLFGCEAGEGCGNCALDCTVGGEVCTGGIDEDCDGSIDCSDSDCAFDPACVCGGPGASCSSGNQCCSGKCKGNGTCK